MLLRIKLGIFLISNPTSFTNLLHSFYQGYILYSDYINIYIHTKSMITSTHLKCYSIYVSNTVNNFFAKFNIYPVNILQLVYPQQPFS